MKVSSISKFVEISGVRFGSLCTLIRLYGCNCKCSYCDYRYACEGDDYDELSWMDILQIVSEFGLKRVTVTGGEPLIHKNVIKLLQALKLGGYEVHVETNGTVNLEILAESKVLSSTIITMDWKSVTSGMSDKMLVSNLHYLTERDALKFVVSDIVDLDQMKFICEKFPLRCNIFVSPVHGTMKTTNIVSYLVENDLEDIRLQL